MKISDFLSPADIAVDLRADSKQKLLLDLSARAAKAANLDAQDVAAAILKREELGSTGIGEGVAIPHTRLKTVQRPQATIARLKHPIAFDAIDGRNVDLVVLLLLPDVADADQLAALAAITRRLKAHETLPRLRNAHSASDIFKILTE
jgi:nitrogen PTS system EIIA component